MRLTALLLSVITALALPACGKKPAPVAPGAPGEAEPEDPEAREGDATQPIDDDDMRDESAVDPCAGGM